MSQWSDGQKQAFTVALIAGASVLLCAGLVASAIFISGKLTAATNPPPLVSAPNDGVLITAVYPNSPAAQANLQPGHVLLQLNDAPITSPEMLTLLLQNVPAGESFTLLLRDEAGELRQTTAVRAAEPPYLGVEIVALPQQTPNPTTANPNPTQPPAKVTQLPVVTGIVPDSPAASVDVQIGDIVTAVDDQAILSGAELFSQMANKTPGQTVALTLRRGEETLRRTTVLAPHPEDAQRGFLGIEFQP